MVSNFDVVDNKTGRIITTTDYKTACEICSRYNSASPYANFKVENSIDGWNLDWADTYLG